MARDHVVEMQFAGEVELDISGHIHSEPIRTHVRSLEFLFSQEFGAVNFDHGTDGNHPDNGGTAARPDHLECLLGGYFETDGLKGIVDTTTGQFADRLNGVVIGGIDYLSGPEFSCEFKFAGKSVHRDDPTRAGNFGTVNA